MDIFETVKTNVKIVDYVEGETGCRAQKVGSTFRLSPCPLCQHNDAFTLYLQDNSFHCFSCGAGGDIISFELLNKSLPDNLSAARAIARKMGMSLEGSEGTGETRPAPKKTKDQPDPSPSIEPVKANALRGIVANFYHDQLLSNQKALDYQVKERGHSLEILKKFKVGYTGRKSVKKHARDHGYSPEDLLGIGLVKRLKNGFVFYLPQKSFVYPHFHDGEVLFFSTKDPAGKLKYQIKKQYAGQGWLCFNQDVLIRSDPAILILVEGENDLLSVVDKAKQTNVACILGNYNNQNILSHLKKHSTGKLFYLAFDRDTAGAKYTDRYAKAINDGGGEARAIKIPDPYNDIDEFLRVSKEPSGDFVKLMERARVIKKRPTTKREPRRDQGGHSGDLYHFDNFTVLGELEDDRIVFEAKDIRKIYICQLKDLTMEKMIQIGGQEARERIVRTVEEAQEDGKVHLYDVRRELILQARQMQRGPLRWIGQGINSLSDSRLLLVNGDLVCIWDGDTFTPYEDAMVENRLISRNASRRWIDFEALEEKVCAMNREKAKEILGKAMRKIKEWGFLGNFDDLLVCGFMFSQMVQSQWLWRPHAWITGPQASGKTLLLIFLEEVGGALARRFEGSSTTEAGFRQSLKYDFCLASIDEFEKSPARDQIMAYLRTAGRGGHIVKGTPGQEAVEYVLKHMVMVASIETGLVEASQKNRFLTIELKKSESRDPQLPTVEEMEKLRIEFFSFALWASLKVKNLIKQLPKIKGYDPRLIQSFSVPLSMTVITDPDPAKSLEEAITNCLDDRVNQGRDNVPEDEIRLLNDILSSRIHITDSEEGGSRYAWRTVGQLLRSTSQLNDRDLEAAGIKKCSDGYFLACSIITRQLLKDTVWKGMNITNILKRIPDATSKQRYLAGSRFWGVLLPKTLDFFVGKDDEEMPNYVEEAVNNDQGDLF